MHDFCMLMSRSVAQVSGLIESMVRSLDPRYNDFRVEPGRRISNHDLGTLMTSVIAESVEQYRGQFGVHATVKAVEELLRAAKARARKTGQTTSQVLREHREALEERVSGSGFEGKANKFLTGGAQDHRGSGSSTAVQQVMDEQDKRRASITFSKHTTDIARDIEELEASRQVVLYNPNNTPPNPHTSGVLRPPAPRHHMGGDMPNADHLRIMHKPQGAKVFDSSKPLKLKHNPTGGGGFHNPITM